MQKPRLSFWQIFNMSFGFMGIQFGWGLQLANMSGIYTYLGAKPEQVPILWLAGPVTGLLVQPIIGSMSDRTWNRLGRRRPYFLTGAILASIALFFMPDSSAFGWPRACSGFWTRASTSAWSRFAHLSPTSSMSISELPGSPCRVSLSASVRLWQTVSLHFPQPGR